LVITQSTAPSARLRWRLRHAVADGLAAAELDLLAVAAGAQRVVVLDLDQQVGVGQADPVSDGGAEDLGIGAASDRGHQEMPPRLVSAGPLTRPRKP
jgi:hypothetical protein